MHTFYNLRSAGLQNRGPKPNIPDAPMKYMYVRRVS